MTPIRCTIVWALIGGAIVFLGGCATKSAPPAPKTYSFWPAAPDLPRVQFLVSYNTSNDVGAARSKFDEMMYGQIPKHPIIKPYGVAIWNGRIYVSDLRSRGVAVLDLRQKQTRIMGESGAGEVQKAIDVAVGPDGAKYVIDSNRNAIVVYSPDERYVSTITLKNFNPVGLAAYGGRLYVADFEAAVVKVIDPSSGTQVGTIGKPGPNDGEFVRPLSVRFDKQGNLLVVDVFKCRVQKFSRDGKFLMAFGEVGNRAGDFVRPKHIDVDSDGYIYIVDAAFSNVQVFDANGKVVGFFGTQGTHPGAMDLPVGLTITDKDLDLFQQYLHPAFEATRLVVVSNQFGTNRVAVYAVGKLKAGKTLADISAGRSESSVGLQTAKDQKPAIGPITIGTPLPPDTQPATTAPATAPGRK